ncbi:MAG: HINT domain-containing protein [Planctomycetaceae bacterium]|nr:HINT domain-containing protein [Planctomycetaceae bacterium]
MLQLVFLFLTIAAQAVVGGSFAEKMATNKSLRPQVRSRSGLFRIIPSCGEQPKKLYHENLGVTENGYWVEAKDLKAGDVLLDANSELSCLIAKERVEYPAGITVYNFTIDGNHDYFVIAQTAELGQTCVLVHNAKYSQTNSTNLRNLGLQGVNLNGKSHNAGRKLLENRGFTLTTTQTGRKEFTKTINGKIVKISFNSGGALGYGQKLHWHIDVDGYDLHFNAMGRENRNRHIPAN